MFFCLLPEVVKINGVESVTETALRALSERSRNARTPTKTSTLIITGVKRVRYFYNYDNKYYVLLVMLLDNGMFKGDSICNENRPINPKVL